jgi:lysophospholipase L1-like esterase
MTISELIREDSVMWVEAPYRAGWPGFRTNMVADSLSKRLPGITETPDFILIESGSNDISQLHIAQIDSAIFVTRMTDLLDTIHAKFPYAKIFWNKPYRDDYNDQRFDDDALNLARWIDYVLNLPEYNSFSFSGPDENVWFKPNINIYSSDRIHPNNLGCKVQSLLWINLLKN